MALRPPIFGISLKGPAVILLAGFYLLAQIAFQENIVQGGTCTSSLAGPVEDNTPFYQQIRLGMPMRFVSIEYKGCFEEQTTRVEWLYWGMAGNLLSLATVASSPFWFPPLLNKGRNSIKSIP